MPSQEKQPVRLPGVKSETIKNIQKLLNAIRASELAKVEQLINEYELSLTSHGESKASASEIVARFINHFDEKYPLINPLSVAAQSNQIQIFDFLANKGAMHYIRRTSPLLVAIANNSKSMYRHLLDNYSFAYKNINILMDAACHAGYYSDLDTILTINHELLKTQLELDQSLPSTTFSVASFTGALYAGRLDIIKELLEKHCPNNQQWLKTPISKMTFFTKDNYKNRFPLEIQKSYAPPLLIAAKLGYHEVVDYLLEQGADPTVTAADGNDALVLASQGKHISVLDVLIKHHKRAAERSNNAQVSVQVITLPENPAKKPRYTYNHQPQDVTAAELMPRVVSPSNPSASGPSGQRLN